MILDWGELITLTLGAGVAGYYLHAGLTRPSVRDSQELKDAVRKAEESSDLITRYEIKREIERLEARLADLKKRQKEWTDAEGPSR